MTIEKRNQIKQLIEADDGTLAKKLEGIAGREEFIKVFADNGIILSEEEADEMMQDIMPTDEELSDAELEGVAGGITWKQVKLAWGIGARVGMLARMIYDKYKYNDAYRNYNWNNVITGKMGFNIGGISI